MFLRRMPQLTRRQRLRSTAWVLVPVLFFAGVPRQACRCIAIRPQEHCLSAATCCTTTIAQSARPAPHSCCQQKEPASAVSCGGNCQLAAPTQACCCQTLLAITAFTLPSKDSESGQSLDQPVDFVTNIFALGKALSQPALRESRLFGPPHTDLVVTLRRFVI